MQKSIEQIIKAVNASQKTLYVLCGLPYSGKTHLAREILKSASCVYVSMDNILIKLGHDWDSNKLPDEQGWKEVVNTSYEESLKALRESLNVLYDSTNHTKASRDLLRKVASDGSANMQIIYVDVSIQTVRDRWEKNMISKTRFILEEKLFNMTIDSLEVPTNDEDPWILKN